MKWLCIFFEHKFEEVVDLESDVVKELEQCRRCNKLRKGKPKAKVLPNGTRACPYLDCGDWCAPPWDFRAVKKDNGDDGYRYLFWHDTECSHCKRPISWRRGQEWYGKGWPAPIAREANNVFYEEPKLEVKDKVEQLPPIW